MAVIKRKPTSPGRRFVVSVVNPDLHKGAPHAPLLAPKKAFRRFETAVVELLCVTLVVATSNTIVLSILSATKDGIPAKVERLEYDPNRTATHCTIVLCGWRA